MAEVATAISPGVLAERLESVAGQARPVSLAQARFLEIGESLSTLFPGGLRRGTTICISGTGGATSLALALLGDCSSQGRWCAVVGLADLGVTAAAEMGADLGKLALVPYPDDRWATVVAALLDGFEVVAATPPRKPKATEARRLSARARQRGAVLLVIEPGNQTNGMGRKSGWPEAPDQSLVVTSGRWIGVEEGYGCLRSRQAQVIRRGRRAQAKEVADQLWLPLTGEGVNPDPPSIVSAKTSLMVGLEEVVTTSTTVAG